MIETLLFLILGVSIMILEQIKRLRALNAQQKQDYESKLAASQEVITNLTNKLAENSITPEVESELNAFESELTPEVKTDA